MDILKGKKVLGKDGEEEFNDLQFDVLGIYFSAHWCPPCRGFTPTLIEYYNKVNEITDGKKGKNALEIVFVSSDRDQTAMSDYFKDMPWKAVSFGEKDIIQALKKEFGVSGIPMLVFLKDGNVQKNGRGYVDSNKALDQIFE